MTIDPTEQARRELIQQINETPVSEIEATEPQTWTTDQLRDEFEVLSFLAPYVLVVRKSDGQKGTLLFRHAPRIYYGFEPTDR